MELEAPNLHDFIMGRAIGSNPKDDLRQIGFEPNLLWDQIVNNPLLGPIMLREMSLQSRGGDMKLAIADFAMTWFTIGACLTQEKHARATTDNLPPLTDEPT